MWTKIDHQFEKYFWNDTDNMVNIYKMYVLPISLHHHVSVDDNRWNVK